MNTVDSKTVATVRALSCRWPGLFVVAVLNFFLVMPADVHGAESLESMQLRLRAMQNRQAQNRYVNKSYMERLQGQINKRGGEIQKTRMKSEALREMQLPDAQLEALKKKAYESIKNNAYDYVKRSVKGRQDQLHNEISKARNARDVADFLEKYTYGKNAPKDNPALTEIYNNVYHEQAWLRRNIDQTIYQKQKELDRLSTFDTIDQGLKRASEMKKQAEQKFNDIQKEIIQGGLGIDDKRYKELHKQLNEYGKYAKQAEKMYKYVSDLKGRADKAGESIPDLPDAAKMGLRNMVYMGEMLKQAGDKINVPGVKDMLDFYSSATQVSLKAAENAQKFKLQHGIIEESNQNFGAYNKTL